MTEHELFWEAWCDGTAAPNPGRIGIGARLVSPAGEALEQSLRPGHSGCNNEAELHAIALALDLAQQAGARRLRIHSDSRFAVDCLNGRDSTEIARLAMLIAETNERLSNFDEVAICWLPRHRNALADRLARAALGLAAKPAAPAAVRKRRR